MLVDIDLSILGAESGRFDEYERQVRAEYDWVPDAIFNTQRAAMLQRFLERPTVYNTAYFLENYEQRARANIERSITKLRTRIL